DRAPGIRPEVEVLDELHAITRFAVIPWDEVSLIKGVHAREDPALHRLNERGSVRLAPRFGECLGERGGEKHVEAVYGAIVGGLAVDAGFGEGCEHKIGVLARRIGRNVQGANEAEPNNDVPKLGQKLEFVIQAKIGGKVLDALFPRKATADG